MAVFAIRTYNTKCYYALMHHFFLLLLSLFYIFGRVLVENETTFEYPVIGEIPPQSKASINGFLTLLKNLHKNINLLYWFFRIHSLN